MRDAEFAAGLDKLDSELKKAVLSGDVKIGKAEIQKMAKPENAKSVGPAALEKEGRLLTEKKSKTTFDATKKQLAKASEKITHSANVSAKDIDKLIEIAAKLKTLLPH